MAQDFSPKNPADADVFTFDYAADMAPGDTMLGSTWAVFVETGVDPTPSVMISGSAASIGTTANQLMIGGVSGVYYRFECRANILQASGTMQSLTKSANCLVVSPS